MKDQLVQDARECSGGLRRQLQAWGKRANVRQEPLWPAIQTFPDIIDAVLSLFEDPAVDPGEKRIVGRVLKYFVSPLDLKPELIYGLKGYYEDMVLVGWAIARWRNLLGEKVLEKHGISRAAKVLEKAMPAAEKDLEEDIRAHLRLILEPGGVAGDHWDNEEGGEKTEGRSEPHKIVFAGPGTGKTFAIEEELVRLLAGQKVPPSQVVVTTFTRKAADELRVRVRDKLAKAKVKDLDSVLQRLFIGTIHSFCFSLISKFHYHLLFLKGTFAPMDETRRLLYLFRNRYEPLKLQGIYDRWKEEQKEAGRPAYKMGWFDFYFYAGDVYDFLSEEAINDQETGLREAYLDILHKDEPSNADEAIIQTYPDYWKDLQSAGYLDQSMVLAYAEALLADPHVCERVRAEIRHILVDEYQDTNPIQDRIFRRIAGGTGRVFAVADDDQSIYGFRGANYLNALNFTENYPGAVQAVLSENRRSTQNILASTQAFIRRNQNRKEKNLTTQNEKGAPVLRLEAPEEDLPGTLADCLRRLKDARKVPNWASIAVLFRGMSGRVKKYREAFEEAGVRIMTSHEKSFLKNPIPRALCGIFEMIGGEAEEITTRKRVQMPFFQALGITEKEATVKAVREWNKKLADKKYKSLLDLYYGILNDTNAIQHPELLPELGRFSALIKEAEEELRSRDITRRLRDFVSFTDAAQSSFEGPSANVDDGVQILTMHRSKGLEFPVVVIAEASEDSFPFRFKESTRDSLKRLLLGKKAAGEDAYQEEERRVLYVGMTRAQKLLLFAAPTQTPSPFLKEVPTQPVPPAGLEAAVQGFDLKTDRHSSPPPLHAAFGHLYNYASCPKRYDLENRYGFAGQAIPPLRKGQSLHKSLEIMHRLMKDGEEVGDRRIPEIVERAWISPPSANRSSGQAKKEAEREFNEIVKIVRAYKSRIDGIRGFQVEDMERPFYVAEQNGVLTGKIDMVRKVKDQLEIVEFKYNRNPLMPDYPRKQLNYYRLAFPEADPQLVVCYLKENKEEKVPVRPAREIREEVAEAFERIRGKKFSARPERNKCKICPVLSVCSEAGYRKKRK